MYLEVLELQITEESLSTFAGISVNVPAFLELRLETFFCISDSCISLKLKRDSKDTYSLIILIHGWSLYFSIATSTTSLDLEFAFRLALASHFFIPNFPSAFLKKLSKVYASLKSSEITFSLFIRVNAEDWIHLLLRRGFIVFQNLFLSVI